MSKASSAARCWCGSDARLLTTLLHRMRRTGDRQGLATMCVGVGQGTAVLVDSD